MLRTNHAKLNNKYINDLITNYNFKGIYNPEEDYHNYKIDFNVEDFKKLLFKNVFYNHLQNVDDLLYLSSLKLLVNNEIIFETDLFEFLELETKDLLGMIKYNLIQKLKLLDPKTKITVEIGLINSYFKDLKLIN